MSSSLQGMPQATTIHDIELCYAVFAAQSAMQTVYSLLDETGKVVKAAYRPLALFAEAIKGLESEEVRKKKEILLLLFTSHYAREKEFLEKIKSVVTRLAGASDNETSNLYYAKGAFHKKWPLYAYNSVLQDLIAAASEHDSFDKIDLPEEHKRALKSVI